MSGSGGGKPGGDLFDFSHPVSRLPCSSTSKYTKENKMEHPIDKLGRMVEYRVKEKLDNDCKTFSQMRTKWFVLGVISGVGWTVIICMIAWELGTR